MKILSRREFVGSLLNAAAVLTAAKIVDTSALAEKDICLSVDQDGNAILHGTKVTVATNGQSRVDVRKG